MENAKGTPRTAGAYAQKFRTASICWGCGKYRNKGIENIDDGIRLLRI